MDSCSENASKIELETRLAKLNRMLCELQVREGSYQTVPSVARRRGYSRSTSQHVRRPRLQFAHDE
jgi:hypothetical protein